MSLRAKRALAGAVATACAVVLGWLLRPDGRLGHTIWPAEAIEPHVIASGKQVALAWMEVAGAGEVATSIAVARSSDGGKTMSAIEHLSAPGGRLSADPTLAYAKDGSLYLSWLSFHSHSAIESEPFDMAIVVARLRPGASRFDGPQLVAAEPLTTYDKPWSSVDGDGILHVVFRSAFANRAGIHEVALHADGQKVFRRLVDEPGFSGALPTVCSDRLSSRSYVAYLRPERGIEVFSFDSKESKTVFETALVSAEGDRIAHAGPSCAVSERGVIVLFGLSDGPWDTARSPQLKALVFVEQRKENRELVRKEIGQPGLLMMYPQLLPSLDGPLGPLQVAFLAGHRDGDSDATLRLLTLSSDLSVEAPPKVEVVRRGLRLTSGREARSWPGDYLGIARSDDTTIVGYIDNDGRRRARLAFFR